MSRGTFALLAIGASCAVAAFCLATSKLPRETRASRGLVIDPSERTVRVTEAGGAQTLFFTVTNTGEDEIGIRGIRSTCGCTVIETSNRRRLKPGETTQFKASVSVPPIGEKTVSVTVEPDSHEYPPASAVLTLKGKDLEAPYLVGVPDPFKLDRTGADKVIGTLRLTTLERIDASPWVRTLHSEAAWITVGPRRSKDSPGPTADTVSRLYEFDVAVRSPDDEEVAALLRIVTDSAQPVTEATIRVASEKVAAVVATPGALHVRVTEGSSSIHKQTIVVRPANQDQLLEINALPSTADWLSVQVDSRSPTLSHVQVEIAVEDLPVDQQIIFAQLRLQTNLVELAEMSIPIFVERCSQDQSAE